LKSQKNKAHRHEDERGDYFNTLFLHFWMSGHKLHLRAIFANSIRPAQP